MKVKNIIIISIIIIVIGALVVLGLINRSEVSDNPSTLSGNTGGNLNNGGLFCEYDGTVYFSNPYDNGFLYSMNPDESKIKRISNVSVVSINADKDRLYYALSGNSTGSGLGYVRKATGMFSCKHNGSSAIAYTQDPVGILSLIGNNIYYQHYTKTTGTDLDCISILKSDNHTVVQDMVSPASSNNGVIYYAGATDDMYLYAFDCATEASTQIYARNMYNPVFYNGDIYYIDLETNYQLHRYNIASGEDITLTTDRIDTFNLNDSYIFYQRSSASDNPALMRMNLDGTAVETVSEGIYCDINITSTYVYFHSYQSEFPTYHTPAYGGINVSIFDAGSTK